MGWQDFSWLLCQLSFPRNKRRLPTSLFLHLSSTSESQHRGQGCDIPPLVWMLNVQEPCEDPLPARLWANSASRTLQPKRATGAHPFPSTVGGPGKFLCKLPPHLGFSLFIKHQFLPKSNRGRKSLCWRWGYQVLYHGKIRITTSTSCFPSDYISWAATNKGSA